MISFAFSGCVQAEFVIFLFSSRGDADRVVDLPQKLLPLQHSPPPHLAFTIGPHVWPIPAVFGGPEGRGGAVRLVAQSPNPTWQVSAPQ